jgi:hypothetical protein
MTLQGNHRRRVRYIRLADHDIARYRELRDIRSKIVRTFLDGAAHLYECAGLSRKARAVRRLLQYVNKSQNSNII